MFCLSLFLPPYNGRVLSHRLVIVDHCYNRQKKKSQLHQYHSKLTIKMMIQMITSEILLCLKSSFVVSALHVTTLPEAKGRTSHENTN